MDKKDISSSHAFDPPEEAVWHRMIAEAAYYRALKVEFAGESALEHWLAAEEEIRRVLTGASTDGASSPDAATELAPPKREVERGQTPLLKARGGKATARGAKGGATKSAARKHQMPKPG
jgi:hypothetical protein